MFDMLASCSSFILRSPPSPNLKLTATSLAACRQQPKHFLNTTSRTQPPSQQEVGMHEQTRPPHTHYHYFVLIIPRLRRLLLLRRILLIRYRRLHFHSGIADADKATIKAQIVDYMCTMPPEVQRQISEALSIISKSDFPAKWETVRVEKPPFFSSSFYFLFFTF